jgi:POT family proton-dependent oligopeptide transporter
MIDKVVNTTPQEPEMFGHPKGLFYLFFAELWERFSFYGMRALLTLYMVQEIFKAIVERDTATAVVYASYGSLVYASTVIGGQISDKILGMRASIFLGGVLMALGHFVLAIQNDIAFFLALAFIVVGNGFFKPNISTFVGSLYKEGDVRKESGFTIFYMGINIGGFVAPLLCGWLAAEYGWHYGFGLAGFGMLTGLFFFWSGIKKNVFGDRGMPLNRAVYEKKIIGIPQKTLIPIIAFLCAPGIAYLLASWQQNYVSGIFKFIGFAVLAYIIFIMIKLDRDARKKLTMAVLITFFMTLFWGFHELSGSVITLFAARNVALEGIMSASQTNALNSMFIIFLAIPISLLWGYLAKKGMNPRTPYKFGFGLVLAGICFYILSISGASADENGMVPFAYLLIMYFIISIGELFMSPIGLSKITDLSPKNIVAFMMGVWFLSSAFAFQIVGFIGEQLAVESTDTNVGGLETLTIYTDGFHLIALYALGAGAIVLLMSPVMKKLLGNVH